MYCTMQQCVRTEPHDPTHLVAPGSPTFQAQKVGFCGPRYSRCSDHGTACLLECPQSQASLAPRGASCFEPLTKPAEVGLDGKRVSIVQKILT